MILAIFYVASCALCWRLRGGLISNITRRFGQTLSTGETRASCSMLMALPLVPLDPWMLVMIPAIFAAMTIGYFDRSMGLEQPGRDHAWLAAWGVAVCAIMLFPIAALHHDPLRLAPAALGALVSAAYAASKAIGGRWTDRAEWAAGAIFGTAIMLAARG